MISLPQDCYCFSERPNRGTRKTVFWKLALVSTSHLNEIQIGHFKEILAS